MRERYEIERYSRHLDYQIPYQLKGHKGNGDMNEIEMSHLFWVNRYVLMRTYISVKIFYLAKKLWASQVFAACGR